MNSSIIDYLCRHAANKPDSIAFRFLTDIDEAPENITFAQLLQEVESIAQYLSFIAQPGGRIILLYPPGLDYIKAFLGCLMAGMIAVPLYPPKKNAKSDKIVKVVQSAQTTVALTTSKNTEGLKNFWRNNTNLDLDFHATDNLKPPSVFEGSRISITSNVPAFLQYTSGSTGVPKGVVISHENIIANVKYLELTSGTKQDDVFVNWLPLFHDLGLVTAILLPLYMGCSSVLMAPATFVRDPSIWLKALTKFKGTIGGAPNFAYDLCYEKIKDQELANIDLSSWRIAYNAAEPVKPSTLEAFNRKFNACGFKPESFYPSYGMAESTAFIAGIKAEDLPRIIKVNKEKLALNQIEISSEDDHLVTALVGCGYAKYSHDLQIIDTKNHHQLAEGEIGEIWFSGPSVATAYWQLDEVSKKSFGQRLENFHPQNRYLRTGDLGFILQEQLYVTGRIKDLIILRGKNYYPQDIELSTSMAHDAVRSGYCASFISDNYQLVIVAEIERGQLKKVDFTQVESAIRQQVFADQALVVDRIVLIQPYKIPITSSGKIQRSATKQLFLENNLKALNEIAPMNINPAVVPESEIESIIHDIWCRILGFNEISVTDNFFDLGGDSIKAIEVSAAVKKQFSDISLAVEELSELANVRQMSDYITLRRLHRENKNKPAANVRTITI